jgi:hypothetical protein
MSTDEFRNESRRKFLQGCGLGVGWLAALDLLNSDGAFGAAPDNLLAPKRPPLPATAKRVISLFMQGGPSQVDTFDPKPLLNKLHGKIHRRASATKTFRTASSRSQ